MRCASCNSENGCEHLPYNVADPPRPTPDRTPTPGPTANAGYVAGKRDYTKTVGRSDEALEARVASVESILVALEARFANANLIPGPRGEKGDPGINGREEVVGELQQFVSEQLGKFRLGLRKMCLEELVNRGVLDAEGNAVPGPVGPRGERGEKGDSIRGEKGDPGERGATGEPSTIPGPQGPVGERGEKGERGADSQVPGPRGEKGDSIRGEKGDRGEKGEPGVSNIPGPQGRPGDISAAIWNAQEAAAQVFAEVRQEVGCLAKEVADLQKLVAAK